MEIDFLHPRHPIGRWLHRAPVLLYRLGLGGLLDRRFLLLTHRGRRTGRTYHTVIEIIDYQRDPETYFVVSGFGPRSDWFRNIQHHPQVTITVGRQRFFARARVLSTDEAVQRLRAFIQAHPWEARLILGLLGQVFPRTEEDLYALATRLPMVAFEVQNSSGAKSEKGKQRKEFGATRSASS